MEKRNIELSDELKQKLRSCAAINIKNEYKYVPKIFREKNATGEFTFEKSLWPIFTLRGLDGVDLVRAEDDGIVDITTDDTGKISGIKLKAGSVKIGAVRRGLLGWKNLMDDEFNVLPNRKFTKNNPCTDDDLRILSPALISELYTAIENESKLTDEELLGLE